MILIRKPDSEVEEFVIQLLNRTAAALWLEVRGEIDRTDTLQLITEFLEAEE